MSTYGFLHRGSSVRIPSRTSTVNEPILRQVGLKRVKTGGIVPPGDTPAGGRIMKVLCCVCQQASTQARSLTIQDSRCC